MGMGLITLVWQTSYILQARLILLLPSVNHPYGLRPRMSLRMARPSEANGLMVSLADDDGFGT